MGFAPPSRQWGNRRRQIFMTQVVQVESPSEDAQVHVIDVHVIELLSLLRLFIIKVSISWAA